MGDRRVLPLTEICLKIAGASEFWRVQRRILEHMPEQYANSLLESLLQRKALTAPTLEFFKNSVTSVVISGSLGMQVTGEWLAYIGEYRCLRELQLQQLTRLKDAQMQPLLRLSSCLQHLSLQGCSQLSPKLGPVLARLTSLTRLNLAESSLSGAVTQHLTGLASLQQLCLGGLPLSDNDCRHLAGLTGLRELSLWGSQVTERGCQELWPLSHLTQLDLSWTTLRLPPLLPSLQVLQLRSCSLVSGWEHMDEAALQLLDCSSLRRLDLAGAQLADAGVLPVCDLIGASSRCLTWLDLSDTSFQQLQALAACTALRHLDLAGARLEADQQLLLLNSLGVLTSLSLRGTRVGTQAAAIISCFMTQLQSLDLSHTLAPDAALPFIARLTTLTQLDISGTPITGRFPEASEHCLTLDLGPKLTAQLGWEPQEQAAPPTGVLHGYRDVWGVGGDDPTGGLQEQPPSWDGSWKLVGSQLRIPSPSTAATRLAWGGTPRLTSIRALATRLDVGGLQLLGSSAPPSLATLQLGSPGINDQAVQHLRRLTALTSLTLQGCQLTDPGLDPLEELSGLQELNISGCWLVTSRGVQQLCGSIEALQRASFQGEVVDLQAPPPRPARSPATGTATQRPKSKGRPTPSGTSPPAHTLPAMLAAMQAHDQRWRYDSEYLCALRSSPLVGCDGAGASITEALLKDLPHDMLAGTS